MGGLSKRAQKRASDHLEFEEIAPAVSGKTKRWAGMNSSMTALGIVQWKVQWRRYVFAPDPETLFDAVCMERIAEFCREETRKHDEECARRRRKAEVPAT